MFTITNVVINIWPFLFCIRLGNLGKTEPGKLFRNFKWLKNREDGSDFDDFWSKQIAALPAKIKKNWAVETISARGKTSKNFREKFEKVVPCTVSGEKQNRNGHITKFK